MSNTSTPLLSVQVEEKSFNTTQILGAMRFNVMPNRFVVILGPSGCGKTTLLRIISGLDQNYTGTIRLNAERVDRPTPQIAMMFQDVRLFPWMTVDQNLRFAVSNRKDAASIDLLNVVGLPSGLLQSHPNKLSGGMMKRVALARTLASEPSIMLLDEPFSELDLRSKYAMYEIVLNRVKASTKAISAVMVTHDITEAVYLADDILILSGKRPSTVSSSMVVNLPHPRRTDSSQFVELCTSLMMFTLSDVHSAVEQST